MIRKSITSGVDATVHGGLNLEELAQFEVSSEDSAHPLENALRPDTAMWCASEEGEQRIRLRFDAAQDLRRLKLRFDEPTTERTQEFVLSWLPDGETQWRELRRQQFNFSPHGGVTEHESFEVNLKAARGLELRITPRMGGGGKASLTFLSVEGQAA